MEELNGFNNSLEGKGIVVLTDEQISDIFCKGSGTYYQRIRRVFEAGRMTAAQECCELADEYQSYIVEDTAPCKLSAKIEDHFDFKAE